MPTRTLRLAVNVPGAFYVDDTCIDCDQCRSLAPRFFARDPELGLSFVHQQPRNQAEIAEATEALQSCPTESIGADGADPSAG